MVSFADGIEKTKLEAHHKSKKALRRNEALLLSGDYCVTVKLNFSTGEAVMLVPTPLALTVMGYVPSGVP